MPPKKYEHTKAEKRQREKENKKASRKPDITDPGYKLDSGRIEPRTQAQSEYRMQIESSNIVFGIGPSGVGKSLIPSYMGADLLDEGELNCIVLVRPLVNVGRDIGALPGEESDKIYPYFLPLLENFYRRFGEGYTNDLIKNNRIVLQPLELMRGMTIPHSWIILDEMQNSTPEQMKTALSRVGKYSKIIVNGDPRQKDIEGESGLIDALYKLKGVDEVEVTEFTKDDVVRSGLAKKIIDAYEGQYDPILPTLE